MKTILIIDESPLIREYLSTQLEALGFSTIPAVNGLDGYTKLKGTLPDLVITDFYLTRKSCISILEDRLQDRNIQTTPVIVMATKLAKDAVVQLARLKVSKIVSKPLQLDILLKAVSEITGTTLGTDDTPCIIDAHLNDTILFIEVARGLNRHKIDQLRYKIAELTSLYQVQSPKVLIMFSTLDLVPGDEEKLLLFFDVITAQAQADPRFIKVLTESSQVKTIMENRQKLRAIQVTPNLEEAMEGLLGMRHDQGNHHDDALHRVLSPSAPKSPGSELIRLGYDETESGILFQNLEIAVVDDDPVIHEVIKTTFKQSKWTFRSYTNGRLFAADLANHEFALIFLDLMMPELNGFQVLEYLRRRGVEIPVIVLSALSRQESVKKAVSYGIHSYMIKPLKPRQVIRKTAEVLSLSL